MRRSKPWDSKKRMKLALKVALLGFIIGLPVFAMSDFLQKYEATISFAFDTKPDPSTFLAANETLFANISDELAQRFPKYHMPLNQTATATFVNDSLDNEGIITYTNLSSYRHSDNHGLWGGIDYTGWTYYYLTALAKNDHETADFALNVLINLTTGFAYMMKVPNGGLGPDYGGILARGYAPPDARDIWPQIFDDEFKHTNGTGMYSDWRYRAYTSNDEFAGYYLFLAMATRYLGHVDYIREKVELIVDQICYNMLRNDFMGIHSTGATTGVTQQAHFGQGGFWIPLLLKLGAWHHPEKYTRLYYHHVANEFCFLGNSEGGAQHVLGAYYPFNFGSAVILAFLLLEDPSTAIWQHYFQGYLDSIWHLTRYHRNAWFNAIFLTICAENGITEDQVGEDFEIIALDIKDQLQRFATHHHPNLHYPTPVVPIPEHYETIVPLQELFKNLPGPIREFFRTIQYDDDQVFVTRPLTVGFMQPTRWVWERSPFKIVERSGNLLRMESGAAFRVPYWMLTYVETIAT